MPPIYRHVSANVPALTGWNGKPCYRAGAPSCQRLMRGAVQWIGDPDFSGYDRYEELPHPAVSAAQMNSALIRPPDETDEFVYRYSVYDVGKYGYTAISPSLSLRLHINVYLDYDATGWTWVAEVDDFVPRFEDVPSIGSISICSAQHLAYFRSSHMDDAFRLGSGVSLGFDGWDQPHTDPGTTWRNSALAGCALYVSAQSAS